RLAEAVTACAEGRNHFPDEPDLLRIQGLSLQEMNSPAEAAACLLHYLAVQSAESPPTADERERLAVVRYQLGRLYGGLGRRADAEAQWRALAGEAPSFTAAWLELGNLYLDQERW